MKNLKSLLTKQLQVQQIPKWIPIVILVIALIGFADAAYLTFNSYKGEIPPCTILGCETVLTSKYSNIIGIPVSLLGALYYISIAVLIIAYLDLKKEILLRVSLLLSVLGLLASVWFTFLQIFIIKAFCQYCVLSAITSTIIFVIALCVLLKNRKYV